MKVLMIGVDKTSKGGMLTVIENYLNDKEFCRDVNLHYIETVQRGNKFVKVKKLLQAIPEIRRTIREEHIDIVHVHMAEKGSVFREGYIINLAKKMGCKTIIHMHGATIEEWYNKQNRIVKKVVRHIFDSADRMIVLGENWRLFMQKIMDNKENIKVLYNAVQVPTSNMYEKQATSILFYGMLIQRKGIDDLLYAFKQIVDEIPTNVNLVLYGDDYDSEEKIEQKIERFGLTNRAIYNGWLTNENKKNVFKEAMMNVLPSYNEGLPMTILETMGYGIPNISTNIAAIPEAIDGDKNGILIRPGDREALKNALKKIVTNDKLRWEYSQNAYNKAKEKFSLKYHLETLKQIYSELYTSNK